MKVDSGLDSGECPKDGCLGPKLPKVGCLGPKLLEHMPKLGPKDTILILFHGNAKVIIVVNKYRIEY